jgi:hypothetical protein
VCGLPWPVNGRDPEGEEMNATVEPPGERHVEKRRGPCVGLEENTAQGELLAHWSSVDSPLRGSSVLLRGRCAVG